VYFIASFSGSGMYGDGELGDEFFWAAAELLVTTGEAEFAEAVRASPWLKAPVSQEASWGMVAPLGLISLAFNEDALGKPDTRALRQRLVAAADGFLKERTQTGYHVPWASDHYPWGSNSNLLNRAMLLALAGDFTGRPAYRGGVVDVMDYLLGRNPLDQSFVTGYGERPMRNPHHRFWAPSFDRGMPAPPPGVLSGGPNTGRSSDAVAGAILAHCAPQTCWTDDARAYSMNEVAINWNAPLVWVTAWLDETAAP